MKKTATSTAFRSITLLLFAATAILAVTAPTVRAQKNVQPEPIAVDPAKRITLEFREASIEEAADYLAKQFEGANFVVPTKVARLRVTLKLRNVTLDQALQAIAFATDNRLQTTQVTENVYGFSITEVQPGNVPEQRAACRIFSLASAPAFLGIAPDKVNKMIGELKDTLESAINLLRQAEPTSAVETPPLQFHPSTKLLIAVGKPEELAIVEELVLALGGGSPPVPQPGVPAGMPGGPFAPFPAGPAGVPGSAPPPAGGGGGAGF